MSACVRVCVYIHIEIMAVTIHIALNPLGKALIQLFSPQL